MLERLLMKYGLAAVFVGSAVEGGDITLSLMGVVAHLGFFDLLQGIIVGSLGCSAGDCVWYWIGRKNSDWVQSKSVYRNADAAVKRFTTRIGTWQILVSHFVYGTRVATMIYWGTKKLRFTQFVAHDLVGCVLWSSLLGSAGYFLMRSAKVLFRDVRRLEIWLLMALICIILLVFIYRAVTKRWLNASLKND